MSDKRRLINDIKNKQAMIEELTKNDDELSRREIGRQKNETDGLGYEIQDREKKEMPKVSGKVDADTDKANEPNKFTPTVKNEILVRQGGECACTDDNGRRCKNGIDEYHHVTPQQSTDRADPWLRSAANGVGVCDEHHREIGHDDDTVRGAVGGARDFPFSHGNDKTAHKTWAEEHDNEVNSRLAIEAKDKTADLSADWSKKIDSSTNTPVESSVEASNINNNAFNKG